MKRSAFITAVIVIVAALLATGSYAFFTHEDTARNVITTGSVDFEIHERMQEGGEFKDFPAEGVEFMPGDTISKIVTVQNISNHPIYLRVKLTKSIVDNDKLDAENCLSMDINEQAWTLGNDGYYYYNEPVAAKAETEALFTKVFVDGWNVDNRYLGEKFSLKIDASAVQSENNGANVMEAAGWPVDD